MFVRRVFSGFVGNVATLVTGTTVGSGIRLLLTPIVARLFFPEHFGVAALFISLATVTSTVGSLRYDQAIILQKEDTDAFKLVVLGFVLLLSFSFLAFALILFLSLATLKFTWIMTIGQWSYALPLAVFLLGLASILNVWNLRKKRFKCVAGSSIANSLTTSGSRVGLGIILGSSVGTLIITLLLGMLCRIGALLFQVSKSELECLLRVKWADVIDVAKSYKDFPLYSAPTGFLLSLSRNLPVLMLGLMFSSNIVGFYALANRLVRIPIDLISESVRSAWLQKSTELKNENEMLKVPLIKTTVGMAGLGIIPCLVLVFFGGRLFAFFLGTNWYTAGIYAKLLTPVFFMMLINAPSSVIFVLFRRQGLLLCIRLSQVVCIVTVFLGCNMANASPKVTLALYACVDAIIVLLSLVIALKIVSQEDKHLIPEVQMNTMTS